MLVRYLPSDSALGRDLSGEGWLITDHLLAAVIDLLQAANWQRQGNKNAKKPKPLPRPGVSHKDSKAAIATRAQEFRERQKDGA